MQWVNTGKFPDKILLVAETSDEYEALRDRVGQPIKGVIGGTTGALSGYAKPGDEETPCIFLDIPEPVE
jgi:hypothetical protein